MRTALILGVVLLSSCAITSGHKTGPNGRPVYFIDGMSASVAYRKASELCPMGYDLLGDPRQTSVVDYVMTIECKAGFASDPPATVSQMAPAAQAATPQVSVASGALSPIERAGQVSSAFGCGSPRLAATSTGRSVFRATCSSGELVIDCSSGDCRVLEQP